MRFFRSLFPKSMSRAEIWLQAYSLAMHTTNAGHDEAMKMADQVVARTDSLGE